MGSGKSGLYKGATPNSSGLSVKRYGGPVNRKDYNKAGSSSVGKVTSVVEFNDLHSMSSHGTPNSVSKNYKNGKLNSERYYDKNGDAYLDIDYTNHGNSKLHPNVPHEHSIHFDKNGNMHRDDPTIGGKKMKKEQIISYINNGREIEFRYKGKMYSLTYGRLDGKHVISFCEFYKETTEVEVAEDALLIVRDGHTVLEMMESLTEKDIWIY